MTSSASFLSDGHAYIEAHSNFLQNTMYRVIDAAIANALSYFYGEQVSVDPFLFPDLVRFWAKRYFKEVNEAYDIADLPNNGLRLNFSDSSIRIWKSPDGNIANPNATKPKREYLTQLELPFGDMPPLYQIRRLVGLPLRLVVLWDVNTTSEAELLLGCPKSIQRNPESVKFHWKLPIPRNVSSKLRVSNEFKSTRTNDLDLELESEKTRTEDNYG